MYQGALHQAVEQKPSQVRCRSRKHSRQYTSLAILRIRETSRAILRRIHGYRLKPPSTPTLHQVRTWRAWREVASS